jgi:carbon storage regulator
MLVLTRKIGESIVIDNNVVVTVQQIRGGRVKLSFDCPDQILVYREEIYQRIQNEGWPKDSARREIDDESLSVAECV